MSLAMLSWSLYKHNSSVGMWPHGHDHYKYNPSFGLCPRGHDCCTNINHLLVCGRPAQSGWSRCRRDGGDGWYKLQHLPLPHGGFYGSPAAECHSTGCIYSAGRHWGIVCVCVCVCACVDASVCVANVYRCACMCTAQNWILAFFCFLGQYVRGVDNYLIQRILFILRILEKHWSGQGDNSPMRNPARC